mmetsp:Transcript_56112/g.76539  ORF Transcript_56112/g.76539 Transcript_56112/m.76539 type:complete len:92 (+) Transcript_56112:645-920(+)
MMRGEKKRWKMRTQWYQKKIRTEWYQKVEMNMRGLSAMIHAAIVQVVQLEGGTLVDGRKFHENCWLTALGASTGRITILWTSEAEVSEIDD